VKDRSDCIQKLIGEQLGQDVDRPRLADRFTMLTVMLKTKSASYSFNL